MSDETELDAFRQQVNCAAVLEQFSSGWKLDTRESTRGALKYRRGAGEIIIVNHDGRGWWDPAGSAKGDVFNLVQHIDPSLNFGRVRQVLRLFIGIAPAYPEAPKAADRKTADRSPAERWARCSCLRLGDSAWRYLAGPRAIPTSVLKHAAQIDCVRCGTYGSAWFAHRDDGLVTQVEIRGKTYKGSLRGGRKTLFRFGVGAPDIRRLAVLEAPIDALSLAALEDIRPDTLYVATGGGMGPDTLAALKTVLTNLGEIGGALVSAADANGPGDRYAARHADIAAGCGVPFERLRPPEGLDWNDVLVQRGAA